MWINLTQLNIIVIAILTMLPIMFTIIVSCFISRIDSLEHEVKELKKRMKIENQKVLDKYNGGSN